MRLAVAVAWIRSSIDARSNAIRSRSPRDGAVSTLSRLASDISLIFDISGALPVPLPLVVGMKPAL